MDSPFRQLKRFPLTGLPTPLQRLENCASSVAGAPELWIKRDDQTTLAMGGNKVRKLEFLLADAISEGADTLVTAGAPQSNHCRLTAAAAARAGLGCHLVLGGDRPAVSNGNVLLDELCGASLHYVAKPERTARMVALGEQLCAAGQRPYLIPVGGSNGIGAAGYAHAMLELRDQFPGDWNTIDAIVVATSSGGTQAGLAVGARALGFRGKIHAISIDQPADREPSYQAEMAGIANECARLLGVGGGFDHSSFSLDDRYLGGGYGVLGALERDAITRLARSEGIFVGPVYSGRALGGMIDLIARGEFSADQKVLFWHTGGAPALFAYAGEFDDGGNFE